MKWRVSHESSLLILAAASVSLWSASGAWPLAVTALLYCLLTYRRLRSGNVPVLRRALLYAGILPFALWFASIDGYSPFFFYIPAWYLLYLAILEWRSVGNGGKSVFVLFDAAAALALSSFEWNPGSLVACLFAVSVFLLSVRPKRDFKAWAFFLSISVAVSAGAAFGIWRGKDAFRRAFSMRAAENSGDFGLMGFSNVGRLGSFSKDYSGRREGEVVFRVYSDRMPVYFKGVAYLHYLPGSGLWKKSSRFRELQTGRFVGNYGGFESGNPRADSVPVWVRSGISLRSVLFAPSGAAGVAVRDVDSIPYFDGDFFSVDGDSPRDWYYWDGERVLDTSRTDSAWKSVPESLVGFLDSAARSMGLSDSPDSVRSNLKKMAACFREKFAYSLEVPRTSREDPLETFVRLRSGFCEYFASLGTLLLRKMDVPARYVTGFAYPERVGGHWVFRRRNAHAWVEFRDAEGFWNVFDPTPSNSRPEVLSGSSPAILWERVRGSLSLFFHELTEGTWRKAVDSFGTWTASALESSSFKIAAALFAFCAGLWIFVRRRLRRRRELLDASGRALRFRILLERAEKDLASQGFVRAPGETVSVFAKRIPLNGKTDGDLKMLAKYNAERWIRD